MLRINMLLVVLAAAVEVTLAIRFSSLRDFPYNPTRKIVSNKEPDQRACFIKGIYYKGADNGYIRRGNKRNTVQECQRECISFGTCRYFNYNTKTKMCWQYDSIKLVNANNKNWIAGPVKCGCFHLFISYHGYEGNTIKSSNMSSPHWEGLEACRKLCRSTNVCRFVVFGMVTRVCKLMASIDIIGFDKKTKYYKFDIQYVSAAACDSSCN